MRLEHVLQLVKGALKSGPKMKADVSEWMCGVGSVKAKMMVEVVTIVGKIFRKR